MADILLIPGPEGPLAGAAMVPAGARDLVVILPGSGPVDRDGNAAFLGLRSDCYRLLAEALAAAGVASLRVDKRGLYGSAAAVADANDVTLADYAQDALAWMARAASMAPRIWLAGHSEGGIVALAAARAAPDALAGVILLATPGRPVADLLFDQIRAMPGGMLLVPGLERVIEGLRAGQGYDPEMVPPPLRGIFAPGLQRYLADLLPRDPAAMARDWSGPALILQGDADLQVSLRDAELLARAMPQAERADLHGATHMLKEDLPGQPLAGYADPALPLHPGVMAALLPFLEKAAGGMLE